MAGRSNGGGSRFTWTGTRRAAVLAVVVCALGLTVAVPLRTYLAQRSEISQQLRQQHQLQSELAHLKHRKAQLSDPDQIEAEARSRLRYVMPGETPYVVQLPHGDVAARGEEEQRKSGAADPSWYQDLWHNVTEGH